MIMPQQDISRQRMDDVELARALIYRLLGRALAEPWDAGFLARLAKLDGDDGEIGTALCKVATAARGAAINMARTEYDALFIGVARGELVPYASFYLTGFLHERPLARVRAEMQALGLARAGGRSDPEDHIASECEVMAALIGRGDVDAQAGFFERHLAPWAGRFFTDLERAASASLFRPVGTLGRLMMDLDRQGFALSAGDPMHKGAA
jgi:TorA maturation chaperone TorD